MEQCPPPGSAKNTKPWATNENLPPNVIKQLAKELKNLDETPPEGIKVGVNDDAFTTIYADIEGPAGTPYENGAFRMKLILSSDFPHAPPKGYFLTKMFHPNIATSGEICVNNLKKDWNPTLGLRHVLLVRRCLLIEPFLESARNEQAGKMLLENYEEYARLARLYTGIHAKPKPKLKQGAISESTTMLNVSQRTTLAQKTRPKEPTINDSSFIALASPVIYAFQQRNKSSRSACTFCSPRFVKREWGCGIFCRTNNSAILANEEWNIEGPRRKEEDRCQKEKLEATVIYIFYRITNYFIVSGFVYYVPILVDW